MILNILMWEKLMKLLINACVFIATVAHGAFGFAQMFLWKIDEVSCLKLIRFSRGFLETITDAQSTKQYQHVGISIIFTNQTGTIAGKHNLTKTHRKALRE